MRHRAFVVSGVFTSGLFLVAGCPDRKSPQRAARMAVEKFKGFTNRMCVCKDMTCVDAVQREMTAWGQGMAKENTNIKPDEETMKAMSELATRYSECVMKLMPEDTAVATVVPDDIPPSSTTRDADTLLRDARTWARTKQPEHFVTQAQFEYVDERGAFDETHGVLKIVFLRSQKRPDDSKRKIGAPVDTAEVVEDCFQLAWSPSAGWSRSRYGCSSDARDVVNKCSPAGVWKKAIERGAPAEGLAKLHMWPGDRWSFTIRDEPRGIDVRESILDDCPLAVEK